jgi:membrane-associated phospholipid phosphatase
MGWDQALLEVVDAHRTPWATALAEGLMAAGQPTATYVAATGVVLVFAWLFKAWRPVFAALLASVIATGLAEAGKEFIGRPRPPADLALVPTDGFAMPSSIGALTAGAAVPLMLMWWRGDSRPGRAMSALLGLGTVLVGVSMVYLGAHWLSDVVAGWLLGATLGVAAFLLLERAPARSERRFRTADDLNPEELVES